MNVTETSSLVEQLIRADMTVEASEVTRGMLARDTHPLPKIFRYCNIYAYNYTSKYSTDS